MQYSNSVTLEMKVLHSRPASCLVQAMEQFPRSQFRIEVLLHGQRASARSVIELMCLYAVKGNEITYVVSSQPEDMTDEVRSKIDHAFASVAADTTYDPRDR